MLCKQTISNSFFDTTALKYCEYGIKLCQKIYFIPYQTYDKKELFKMMKGKKNLENKKTNNKKIFQTFGGYIAKALSTLVFTFSLSDESKVTSFKCAF